jgi:adenylosuccinate synthase
MSTLAIEGLQWGDEGKGKITDYYAEKAEVVVRSQGGDNAGHSIVHKGHRYALRLLPSGVFNPKVINVLADGMVINPSALSGEIEGLKGDGVGDFHLLISSRASILLPYHIALDHAREEALGKAKIGTTGHGVGPCYEDRASRIGVEMGDLLYPDYLHERLSAALMIRNKELSLYNIKPFDLEEVYEGLLEESKGLLPYITDTSVFLQKAVKEKKKILFEGAQGAMLCLLHGTYPFVTSSSPLATAIPLNTGLPLSAVDNILGIVKAYSTRVGAGPFPSELDPEEASLIRERGHEYGTVTKRPRRIGWIDTAELRYASALSGVHYVAIMLLDVLGAVSEINLVTHYLIAGKEIGYMPSTVIEYGTVKPVYETLPSWTEDLSGITTYEALPLAARRYVEEIERLTGLEAILISVGPDKDQTILRKEIFK